MINPLKQTPTRDMTLNSGSDAVRRIGLLVFWGCLVSGFGCAVMGFAQGDRSKLIVAGGCGLVSVGLWVTRRTWCGGCGPAVVKGLAARSVQDALVAEERRVIEGVGLPGQSLIATGLAAKADGRRPRILLLNGSLAGATGNSARLLARVRKVLEARAELDEAALAGPEAMAFAGLEMRLRAAEGLVIATGTHWDSWSSVLQRFLEEATPAEATSLWLGKPVAVLVSEHSTGGKGVLSRLQGVLVTLGCVVPPLTGLVVSQSGQLARRHAVDEAEDFWCVDDVEVVAENLLLAARLPPVAWRTWPVDRKDFARVWVE